MAYHHFRRNPVPEPIAMPKGNGGVPDLPDERIMYPDAGRAGKVATQTYDVIRTRRLEIVNNAGQTVVEMFGSSTIGGHIFVNSPEEVSARYLWSVALFILKVLFLLILIPKMVTRTWFTLDLHTQTMMALIVVNSKEGKNLITLGSDVETGDGFMGIRNKNEERLLNLFAHAENPRIHINKSGNENLAYIGASTLGNGLLSLKNKSGKRLVSMFAEDMSGHLQLWNNNDKTIAYLGTYSDYLGTHSDGSGVLEIFSKTGTELITAGSNTYDDGLLRVSNRYGTLGVWIVGANDNGYVGIQDNRERLLAELGATANGNGLVRTLSPQGITTWSSNSVQVNTGSGTSLKGDMDNDGDIDGDDFLLFSENFGKR